MADKAKQIDYGIEKIQEILKFINPEKIWNIYYLKCNNPKEVFDDWDIKYHNIFAGEEYVFVLDGDHLLYAINVTGNSTLCTLSELMKLLVDKF